MLAFLVPSPAAQAAGALEINPIRIVLTEDQPVATVNIRNRGDSESVVHLQIVAWTQVDGENQYDTEENVGVIACPNVCLVAGDDFQIARIAIQEPPGDWNVERAYRLIVQEVPPPLTEEGPNVQVTLRISIPVFLEPAEFTQPSLVWEIEDRDEDGLWMSVHNQGIVHALISNVRLNTEENFDFEAKAHEYVLPGSTISWRLDAVNPIVGMIPESVELIVSTDQGVYQETQSIKK